MYTLYFHFDRKFLQKSLDLTNTLNANFCEIFEIPYKWMEYKNLREFFKQMDTDFHLWNIGNIDGLGPHNELKIWDDSFDISVEIGFSIFQQIKWSESDDIFREKLHIFCEKMMKNTPAKSVTMWNWDSGFDFKLHDEFLSDGWKYAFFGYFRENEEVIYKNGWNKYWVKIFGKNVKPRIEKRKWSELLEEFFGK